MADYGARDADACEERVDLTGDDPHMGEPEMEENKMKKLSIVLMFALIAMAFVGIASAV